MENESIRKWLIGLSVLGALLVGFMGQRWLLPEEHRLVFAAGQRGGLYHELAQHLASELQAAHPRLSIEVIETNTPSQSAPKAVDPSSLLMNYSVTSAWRRRN